MARGEPLHSEGTGDHPLGIHASVRYAGPRRADRQFRHNSGDQADEQDGVNGVGGVGLAEPDPLGAFLAAGPHPAGELASGGGVVDDHGFRKSGLPATNSCPPDLGAVIAAAAIS